MAVALVAAGGIDQPRIVEGLRAVLEKTGQSNSLIDEILNRVQTALASVETLDEFQRFLPNAAATPVPPWRVDPWRIVEALWTVLQSSVDSKSLVDENATKTGQNDFKIVLTRFPAP